MQDIKSPYLNLVATGLRVKSSESYYLPWFMEEGLADRHLDGLSVYRNIALYKGVIGVICVL